jgi:GT2 family glycosyltransferase
VSNPVLILTHNGIDFTKRCVKSVLAQDAPTSIVLFDNGSKDGTIEWAKSELPKGTPILQVPENLGVSFGWNSGLKYLFESENAPCVLVLNNDVIIPPWFLRELAACGMLYDHCEFVTGVAVDSMEAIQTPPQFQPPNPHPDFSAFLIGRSVWEKVGPFSEDLWSWCSDCDYHVRAHRLGIHFYKANVPFYHVRSRTIELAPPKEKRTLELQADVDRLNFSEKWKTEVGSPQYADLFAEEAFGIDLD